MKDTINLINVVHILREFMRNEAQTLEISKGKMLDDKVTQAEIERILRVS